MVLQQYTLLESNFTVNDTQYTTYGIALSEISEGYAVIIDVIPDLSADKERVHRLADRCSAMQLSPLHLRDVVEDFLSE